ncbi:MAG TPA: c-type cytochrome [Dongiaceae bacterium]
MPSSLHATLACAVLGLTLAASTPALPDQLPLFDGDAARGARLYKKVCAACHSMDANRVGPMHRGVVGRPVASVAGFRYSEALAAQTFVWDEAALDRWLENPPAMVPGTAMGIRVRLAEDRADLIAYLRAEGAKPPP